MRNELQTVHDMQMSLLPDPLTPHGYTMDGVLVPANNVGGDYFNLRWLDDRNQKLSIVIADVSGKAMEAAVTALRFSEMLRYEARHRTGPTEILHDLDASLEGEIDTATLITCCVAILDLSTHTVQISNAGHCPLVYVGNHSGLASPVELTRLPLSIGAVKRPSVEYCVTETALSSGNALVLYSDGLIDAQSSNGQMFEEPRLLELLKDAATWSAKRMTPCAESGTSWSASSERPPERMT